jgi:hypothetical protein
MAVTNAEITEDDLIRGLPFFQGGLALQSPPAPQVIKYYTVDGVTGTEVDVDQDELDMSLLEDLEENTIRRRLLVFRNGYKIRYKEGTMTSERDGFNIDYINHRLTLAYDADDEDFEIYLFPS